MQIKNETTKLELCPFCGSDEPYKTRLDDFTYVIQCLACGATVLYEFQIGSYAPVDHWLKCRKKDAVLLTPDDIEHVRSMLCVIKRTIEITNQIGELKQSYLTDMLEPIIV